MKSMAWILSSEAVGSGCSAVQRSARCQATYHSKLMGVQTYAGIFEAYTRLAMLGMAGCVPVGISARV